MKSKNNKGLIKVILSERNEDSIYSIDFFENYFNEDCGKYLRYLVSSKTVDNLDTLYNMAYDMGCSRGYVLRLMYEKNPENVKNRLISEITYDYIDGMIYLNKSDIQNMLTPDWLSSVLFDGGEFYETFNTDYLELDEFLTEKERKILEDNPDLKDEAKTLLIWAQNQELNDRLLNIIMGSIKDHFEVDKIFFDEDTKGDPLIKFEGEKYIESTLRKWFELESDEYLEELFDCSSVECLYFTMINNLNGKKIEPYGVSTIFRDYDIKKVEEYFHENFRENIG